MGYTSKAGAGSCSACLEGKFTNNDRSECVDCLPGQFVDVARTGCYNCPGGKYAAVAVNDACLECGEGVLLQFLLVLLCFSLLTLDSLPSC